MEALARQEGVELRGEARAGDLLESGQNAGFGNRSFSGLGGRCAPLPRGIQGTQEEHLTPGAMGIKLS